MALEGSEAPTLSGDSDLSKFRVTCLEGQRVVFDDPASASERLVGAWFGDAAAPWEVGPGVGFLCTDLVRQRILKFVNGVQASRACLKQDPAPGKGKALIFEFREAVPCRVSEKRLTTHARAEDVASFPEWVAFVRHAQALHNVDEALTSQRDNPLTPFGREQAAQASLGESGNALRSAELVVTSPLLRALETTELLLGDLAAEVPVLVSPLVAERWSAPCDEGSPKSELLPRLSARMQSWEGWEAMPDEWWADPGEDIGARVQEFVDYVRKRPETRIAFVGHGGFWSMVTDEYLSNCKQIYCDRHLEAL